MLTEKQATDWNRLVMDIDVYHAAILHARDGGESARFPLTALVERYKCLMAEFIALARLRFGTDDVVACRPELPFPSIKVGGKEGWIFPSEWPPGYEPIKH